MTPDLTTHDLTEPGPRFIIKSGPFRQAQDAASTLPGVAGQEAAGYFFRWLDFAHPPEMTSDKSEARPLTGAEADFILLKMERMGFEAQKELIPPPSEKT